MSHGSDTSLTQVLLALRDGIQASQPLSMVRAALVFALSLGTDEDWHLADGLMELTPEAEALRLQSQWGPDAGADSREGMLVHYFWLRHRKIRKSEWGTAEDLSRRLSWEIATFPEWLKMTPRFSSLAEVFQIFLEEDFEDSLSAYLKVMPRNRASAQEILREMGQWDEWLLYQTLLQDFRRFLSKEELDRVMENYKKKFFVPLPALAGEEPGEKESISAQEE